MKQFLPKMEGGVLLFFTSYANLAECYKVWSEMKIDFGGTEIFKEEKDHKLLMKSYE